ncbi:MAG TPA: hypothetical protein PK079_08310 [Leptospiraceae bacterium]|nr:hypothetical protein [Leptospiraceae bacterium]HMW06328.1 hypothetical protein [Leptospiraceae bacterium]HMX30993.1 hypothetical protein [Leptospiraceae bacterium]HMY32188.1 hypothetical protein [Leptospiraceae bacterium]HMZ63811.1 hypothetical protein [Leptospiraceae bacterium]
MKSFWKSNINKISLLISILCFQFLFIQYFKYLNYIPDHSFKRNKNAIWIGHKWVGEYLSDEDYSLLCAKLQTGKITDVFAHVGPLASDGSIPQEKYPYAREFLNRMRDCSESIHIQAWIGQLEKKGGGKLDITQSSIRESIVLTAESFLNLGFDGIHYNIEPIYSGDESLLDILKKTHTITKKQDKILSMATDEIEPFPFADKFLRFFSSRAGLWTSDFYIQVANNVDQISVMMYDTGTPLSWVYAYIVKRQVIKITSILEGKVTLFFGVPTYEEERWSFHSEAENIFSGIRGVSLGIDSLPIDLVQDKFGIAIYAEWTTDDTEWKIFRREWLLSL